MSRPPLRPALALAVSAGLLADPLTAAAGPSDETGAAPQHRAEAPATGRP